MVGSNNTNELIGKFSNGNVKFSENIIHIESTQDQQVLAALYSLADVVTSLSYTEAMGLTPIEGMACGTPTIVYGNTAQPELVTEETGIVVKTGDIEGVAEAIKELLNNKDKYNRDNCINRAVNSFDKNNKYLEYIDLYNSLNSLI